MKTGLYFDNRELYHYLQKYCRTNNCLFEPYFTGDEYGVSVPVTEKVDPICEFLKVFVDGMKYNNLSKYDVDFADFYDNAFSIWKDLLGEQKADELYKKMDSFYNKLWNEEGI